MLNKFWKFLEKHEEKVSALLCVLILIEIITAIFLSN